jgi:hypothetical protein
MPANNIVDTLLVRTKALPNGAASTSTDAIDLQSPTGNQFKADIEFQVGAPALGVTPLADAKTMIYKVEQSHDNSSWASLYPEVLRQTGAGGVGAAAATMKFKVPTDVRRYIRVTATGSTSGDASGSSFTVTPFFGSI